MNIIEIKDKVAQEAGQKSWNDIMHKYGGVGNSIVDRILELSKNELIKQSFPNLSEDWTEVSDNSINVPDELDPLLNKIGMQIQFMLFSDKDKNLTICHILRLAEEFFHTYYINKVLL
ncbi:hypothetical protein HER18_02775 [Chryseobacterium sp. NEB161]|nr:hypothetical protein HER18_02775 [Chryseobacterium sp. NEB161]